MTIVEEPIICGAADLSIEHRALARVRESLCLPPFRPCEEANEFIWRPGRLQQHVAASSPISIHDVEYVRLSSRIPVLRDIDTDPAEVEHTLAQVNHYAHRSSYVFDPDSRSIDAVQSILVSDSTFDSAMPRVIAGCQLQFLHTIFHGGRLQSILGGCTADGEWSVESELDRPFEAADALRLALLIPESGGSLFADAFEMETIAEQANAVNAYSAGGSATGVVIECPFAKTTALLGLKTDEAHPLVGQGLLAYIKLPIFGGERELARIAGWLNRKEASGELPTDQSGSWTVRKQDDTHVVAHVEALSNSMHQPGLALHTARAMMRKVHLVNVLLNPGISERNVLDVLEERMRLVRRVVPNVSEPAYRAPH